MPSSAPSRDASARVQPLGAEISHAYRPFQHQAHPDERFAPHSESRSRALGLLICVGSWRWRRGCFHSGRLRRAPSIHRRASRRARATCATCGGTWVNAIPGTTKMARVAIALMQPVLRPPSTQRAQAVAVLQSGGDAQVPATSALLGRLWPGRPRRMSGVSKEERLRCWPAAHLPEEVLTAAIHLASRQPSADQLGDHDARRL